MKREITYSIALHITLIMVILFSSPFSSQTKPFDYGQVIQIKAVSIPANINVESSAPEEIVVPQAMPDEALEIPLDDPKAIEKPVEIEKPKPKDKPTSKPDQKSKTKPDTDAQNTGKEIEGLEAGSPFAGATVDNATFDYPSWFNVAINKIRVNFKKTVPLDGTVICTIHMEVIRSGRLVAVEVIQSSGIEAIDRDCLAAIERSAPFPPLPREFRDEIIGIDLPFRYHGN